MCNMKDISKYVIIIILILLIFIILIKKILKKGKLIDEVVNKIEKIDKNISEFELYANIKNIIMHEKEKYGKEYINVMRAQINENDVLQYLSINISLIALIISLSSLLCEIFNITKISVLYEVIFFLIVFLIEYFTKFHALGKYQNYIIEIIGLL